MRRGWHASTRLALALVLVSPLPLIAQSASAAGGGPTCRIVGRVLDVSTGEPVVNASLWFESTGNGLFLGGTGSSTDGAYAFETSECESGVLYVTRIGYVDASFPIDIDGDGQLRGVTIRLIPDPVEVEELLVDVPRSTRLRDVGFYARKAWEESTGKDLGQFWDFEEVEGRGAGGSSALAMARRARIRWVYGGCAPSVYINGVWFRARRSAERMLDYGLRVREIAGMEIYRAIWGAVPDEFRDPNSNTCGAIIVWTKGGERGEAPQIEVELCEPSGDAGAISFGGVVRDRMTGVALPAAYVSLTTTDTDSTDITTVSDENGLYRYCDLDVWPATLQARFGLKVAQAFEVDPGRTAPGFWSVDLEVDVVAPGTLVGLVVGEGIDPQGTEVVLQGTDRTASPNENGYFEIHDLPTAGYILVLKRGDEVLMRRRVSIYSGLREVVTLDLGNDRMKR